MGTRRHRWTGIAALAIALTGAAPAGAAPASTNVPCRPAAVRHLRGDMREVVRFRTFYVDAKPQAETYKIGTKAKIDITVTRPAHEDPLDLGVGLDPPTSAPAENVSVGVGIHVGDVFIPGFSRTDAEGHATVVVKLPTYMKPGAASVAAYAWNVVHESPCLRVEEDGYSAYPDAFEVTR